MRLWISSHPGLSLTVKLNLSKVPALPYGQIFVQSVSQSFNIHVFFNVNTIAKTSLSMEWFLFC